MEFDCHQDQPAAPASLCAFLAWIFGWFKLWTGAREYTAPPKPEDSYEPNRTWRRLNKHKTPAEYSLKPFYIIYGRAHAPYKFLTKVARISGMGRVLIFMLYPRRAARRTAALAAYLGNQGRREHGTAMGRVGLGLWAAHLWPA